MTSSWCVTYVWTRSLVVYSDERTTKYASRIRQLQQTHCTSRIPYIAIACHLYAQHDLVSKRKALFFMMMSLKTNWQNDRVYLVKCAYISLWNFAVFSGSFQWIPVTHLPILVTVDPLAEKKCNISYFTILDLESLCSLTTSLHTYWHCIYMHYLGWCYLVSKRPGAPFTNMVQL